MLLALGDAVCDPLPVPVTELEGVPVADMVSTVGGNCRACAVHSTMYSFRGRNTSGRDSEAAPAPPPTPGLSMLLLARRASHGPDVSHIPPANCVTTNTSVALSPEGTVNNDPCVALPSPPGWRCCSKLKYDACVVNGVPIRFTLAKEHGTVEAASAPLVAPTAARVDGGAW